MSPSRRYRGFTLIELMVAVVVASILLAVAVPSYQQQVRKSRRTEAKAALLDLAGREERFMSTNGVAYSNGFAALGYAGWGAANPVGSGYYSIAAPVICNSGAAGCPTVSTFTITAVPVAGTTQALDTPCQSFTVTSTGLRTSADGGGADTTATCWQ
jgi:type IV pilus assembly protein PilE